MVDHAPVTRERFRAVAGVAPLMRAGGRWISYSQAEGLCERLAAQLVEQYGRTELRRFGVQAIPRGGLIVLGLLAYLLDLRRDQFEPDPDRPLLLVDDCAISGVRFRQALQATPAARVLFTPLLSTPALRAAIVAAEPRVLAVHSADDLRDVTAGLIPDPAARAVWEQSWATHGPAGAYWIGQPELVGFAWSEPDQLLWNASTGRVESGWALISPDRCLKTRARLSAPLGAPVQGERGPLRPAPQIAHGDFGESLLLANLASDECIALERTAADVWRALIASGTVEGIVELVAPRYDVEPARLRADVEDFVAAMHAAGFLAELPSGA
ncbi:MAG: PqqD family protein [Ardenticatenaceae bacterium]|nr:PqqD family protein [Ardenticatenaceae bacterium]